MESTNGTSEKVTEIIAGIKLVEKEVRVKVPVFEDVIVERPVFKDVVVQIPVGYDKVVNALALEISQNILKFITPMIDEKLAKVIDERIKEIKVPKIIEEIVIRHKEVEVEKPVYKEVVVDKPVYVDKEIINPVIVDHEVKNAILVDIPVANAVIQEIQVTNAIITDVHIDKAIIHEKVIDVIHPRYLDLQGKPVK